MLKGKNVLITGGTGSLGHELAKQILEQHDIRKLVIFSRDELKQYKMAQEFNDRRIRFFIGDVRDKDRLCMAFRNIDIVIHAAALKHVPICEYNPFEAVKTNILGAQNVIEASLACNVKKVIALSTDKAANPINLYGATKLASDKLFVSANNYSGERATVFSVVRYGNVLGSRGSVIPFFLEESKKGVLPITDLEMTRFWITLKDASMFIVSRLDEMSGGETFIPKIPSMKIIDLAKAVASDCEIDVVGIRPGEKLHEIMITQDDANYTWEFDDFYAIKPCINVGKDYSYFSRAQKVCDRFQYTSDTNSKFLSVDELKKIVENLEL
jgi:UDP-N-acetylglucosamine 4,6-dehydratase/5-epimerase